MGLFHKTILLFLFLFFTSSLVQMLLDYRRNTVFYENTRAAYNDAREKNKSLLSAYALGSDVHEFEKNIRNRLNFHKKNEIVVMIPPPTPTPSPVILTPIPVYRQWIDVFISD